MTEKLAALKKMASYVQEAGYKALVEDDHHIKSFMSGYSVLIFYNPNIANIQFYAGFGGRVTDEFNLPQANAFNELWKYTKCLIKDNGAVAFQADFMFLVDQDDANKLLAELIAIWETTLTAGVRAMLGQT